MPVRCSRTAFTFFKQLQLVSTTVFSNNLLCISCLNLLVSAHLTNGLSTFPIDLSAQSVLDRINGYHAIQTPRQVFMPQSGKYQVKLLQYTAPCVGSTSTNSSKLQQKTAKSLQEICKGKAKSLVLETVEIFLKLLASFCCHLPNHTCSNSLG